MCAYTSVSIWFSERRDVGVEETLVSSWIDSVIFSIGLHVQSCFFAIPTGKLSFLEIVQGGVGLNSHEQLTQAFL